MKQKLLSGFILLVLMITGITVLPALAQDDDGDTGAACMNETELIASLLGVDANEVEDAQRSGTLDDLAAENGVELSALAEALLENKLACDNEVRQNTLPEQICASLEGHRPLEIRLEMNQIDWNRAAAEALGLPLDEVLSRGESIASLAEAQGIDVQTVINTIVEEASRFVYAQNQTGFISDEEASKRLSELAQEITDFVNQSPGEYQAVSVLDAAREALGLSVTDFYQALVEGKTLAEIASDNGVSEEDLLNAVIEAATTGIENARDMGLISDCVADVRLNRLQESASAYINRENPAESLFGLDSSAFSFSFGRPGQFNFQMIDPTQIIPMLPDFFRDNPDRPFFFFDDKDFQFQIRPGDLFGGINFQCAELEALENGSIQIKPGQRGEIEIITPEGTFSFRDLMENCIEIDIPDEGE